MTRSTPPPAPMPASPDDVEALFYEALREADLDKLMALWADDDAVFCVHPGGPRVVGAQAIRATFDAVFSSTGRIQVQAERVRRLQTPETAVHNLVERVEVHTADGMQTGFVLATNVYIKTALGWRMVAHHASPGTAQESPEIVEAPAVLH